MDGGWFGEQRQQPVRRAGGDDFDASLRPEMFERADEIALVITPRFARQGKFVVIHPRQFAERAVPVRAVDFLFGQFDQAVQMPLVTPAQQRVEQHGAERRRKRKRQAGVDAVALPALQHLDERDVGFGDGLKQPAFLQKFFVFRMAHKRQVRVQDDGEVTLHVQRGLTLIRPVCSKSIPRGPWP